MSGALAALGTLGTIGGQVLTPLLGALPAGTVPAWIRNVRKIGAIIPDCVIEEQHSDRVTLTQHPVADNAPISDHAFIQPATLTMRIGWTNANLLGAIAGGAVTGFQNAVGGGLTGALGGAFEGGLSTFKESRAKEIYEKMIALQQSMKLIDVVTGKRTYKNMMLVDMSVKTDHMTEYALMMECHFQEVRMARTSTTSQPAMADQKAPDKTGKTENGGAKTPENVSVIQQGRDLVGGSPGHVSPGHP